MIPILDLERQSVAGVRLGDGMDAVQSFGQPQRVRSRRNHQTLEYAGFELEVQDNRLVCIKVDIDPGMSVTVGDIRLSHAVKPLDAQIWFGEPSSDSTGGDGLRWMDFERNGATLALEFDAGGLRCVQLYAEGYA